MPFESPENSRPRLGLIGFGAFGRLVARHLAPYVLIHAYDPAMPAEPGPDVVPGSLRAAADCPVVILAAPVPGSPASWRPSVRISARAPSSSMSAR